jgi:hypothetical protein
MMAGPSCRVGNELLGAARFRVEEFTNGAEEVDGACMGMNIAVENLLEGDVVAVVGFGVFRVLVDDVAVEVDTGEDTLATRVGEEASVCEDAGGGLGIATNRAGGYGDVATELNLLMKETLCTVVSDSNENEVSGLAADLEAEACTGELDEGRSAPAVAGAAGDDALTIFAAYDEGTLLEARDDGDAGCVHCDVIGDATIGGSHQFMENFVGCFDAVIEFGFVGRVGVRADEDGKQDERE